MNIERGNTNKKSTENKNVGDRRLQRSRVVYISIAILTVLLNVIAWNSTAFCDAYIAYIFPIWVNTYGRVMGWFPFSVGEWMLVAGVLLVVTAVLLGVATAVLAIVGSVIAVTKRIPQNDMCRWKTFVKGFYKCFAWILLIVCVIMTLNCSILYHASTFSENYFEEDTEAYTLEEFIRVYNFVAEECNRLSLEVPRDAEGKIVYDGTAFSTLTGNPYDNLPDEEGESFVVSKNRMADEAIACMQKLGEKYPQLDGWYPRPKPMMFSDLMCQQYMCGYYFPFSMEANYNDMMYVMNKPATLCHELAHLRGYIYEDEANFIAYLACLESEDEIFQYAGYLSVITYLYNDLYNAYVDEPEAYRQAALEVPPVPVLEQVWEDNTFVEQEEWDRINGKALVDTETVEEISDTFTDTTLKLNGVSDGMVSYSRVVRLLLQYYTCTGLS